MADREVNVRVLVSSATGPDQVSPAVDQQIRKVEALQQAAAKPVTVAVQPGPVPPVPTLAPPGGARPTTTLTGFAPAGTGPLLNFAPPGVGPLRPPPVTAAEPGGGPGVGPVAAQAAFAAASGSAEGLAHAVAGAAVVTGGWGVALGAAVPVVLSVASAFSTVRDSSEALTAAFRQNMEDLRAGRMSGTADAEQLRRALSAAEQMALAQAQRTGNVAQQQAILQGAERRLGAQVTAEGGGTAERQARLQAELEFVERISRSTSVRLAASPFLGATVPGGSMVAVEFTPERMRQAALRRAGVPESAIPAVPSGPMTGQQIRELSSLAGRNLVSGEAGLQTIRNALRPGGMPSLTPGGLTLADLPNLFQSRQTENILDIHAQIQQEAVRDAREQNRFNQQMELWERIYREIASRGGVVPATPVVS
jgi:hypothetical protein